MNITKLLQLKRKLFKEFFISTENSKAVYEWNEVEGWSLFTKMNGTLDYSFPTAIPYNV
jgi:hypothetical protein